MSGASLQQVDGIEGTSRLLSTEERIQASRDRHSLKQIDQPEDIADLALFLLSEKARWITGQVWGVDRAAG
jgi:NAD(P)-dependent dehydrogenase (short-subunit alcohol dehydrogenase family)